MYRFISHIVIIYLVLVLIFSSCAPVKPPGYPIRQPRKQHLPNWLGVYSGTIVYVFGDITDKKGDEGFPVTLAFIEEGGEILFDMNTHHQNMHWLFHLPPALFRTKSIEFIRNAQLREKEFQIKATFTIKNNELSGTIKMFSRSQDGSLERRGSYLLDVEKQNL